jgi:hypothetical protein
MFIPVPWIFSISDDFSFRRSLPSKMTLPLTMLVGGESRSPRIARPNVVLPEPLSPTMPTTSPFLAARVTPFRILTLPSTDTKSIVRSLMSSTLSSPLSAMERGASRGSPPIRGDRVWRAPVSPRLSTAKAENPVFFPPLVVLTLSCEADSWIGRRSLCVALGRMNACFHEESRYGL